MQWNFHRENVADQWPGKKTGNQHKKEFVYLLQRWRELKNNLALPSDDSVASYLLSVYSKFVIHGDGQEGPFEQGNDNPLQSPMDEAESFHEHQDGPSRIQFTLSNRSHICMENEWQEDSTR